MEYWRQGRTVIPVGGIYQSYQTAIEHVQEFEEEPRSLPLKEVRFGTNEEGYLTVHLGEELFFITYPALKTLAKTLKLPPAFINKFPPSRLVLEALNNNPYLLEENSLANFVLWKWKDRRVISGFLSREMVSLPLLHILQMAEDYRRDDEVELESIALTGEEVVLYFLLPEEIARDGFEFRSGFALHYSPTLPVDTVVSPFYRMAVTSPSGEIFDFDFEAPKRLRVAKRRKSDFEQLTLQFATQYRGEDLGVDLETNLKRGIAARQLSEVRFSVWKALKSRTTSVYNYNGLKVERKTVTGELLPEYHQFLAEHQELLKNKEPFEINSLLVNFYFPLLLNRIYTFPPSSESPYFLIRYRRTIGRMFNRILEEMGDMVLDD